jgi:hypothetical protein
MTPEDLRTVQRTWSQLRLLRAPLLTALALRFDAVEHSMPEAERRATWLVDAVEDLVGLLATPSRLADHARVLGESWPDPLTAPCFAVEGRAWLDAASDCLPTWSERAEASWRQAWLLLSDVLAVEALSPFTARPHRTDEG